MSTWINRATLFAALGLLAGCTQPADFGTTRSAAVLDGSLNIGVPPGYCINSGAGRAGADTAVVLMGRCANNSAAIPALISISVGPDGSAQVMAAGSPALAAYFASDQGRATLSRTGNARDIKMLDVVIVDDALLLHLKDRTAGEYWRAVTGLRGRLVTISATGTAGAPLGPEDGRRIIDAALHALLRVNSETTG